MRCLISILLSALAVGGCAKPHLPDVGDSYSPPKSNYISIAELKNRYLGGVHPLVESRYFEGRVVANDLFGEYSRALIVEDSTAAIELHVAMDDINSRFEIGSHLRVVCDDLWLASRRGVTIVGAQPAADDYLVGAIAGNLLERSVALVDSTLTEIVGMPITIDQLNPSLISRRVLVCDVMFVDSACRTFANRDTVSGRFVNTSHMLRSLSGDEIELNVASTVSYAEVALPRGLVNLEAVVEYGAEPDSYALRIVCFMVEQSHE